MALEINNTVSVASSDMTLGQIREFVEQTKTFADETRVKGATKLSATYGDVTGNH